MSSVGRVRSSSAGKRSSAIPPRVALESGSTEVGKVMVISLVVRARKPPPPAPPITTSRLPAGLSMRSSLGCSVGAPVAMSRTSCEEHGSSQRRVTLGTGCGGVGDPGGVRIAVDEPAGGEVGQPAPGGGGVHRQLARRAEGVDEPDQAVARDGRGRPR